MKELSKVFKEKYGVTDQEYFDFCKENKLKPYDTISKVKFSQYVRGIKNDK